MTLTLTLPDSPDGHGPGVDDSTVTVSAVVPAAAMVVEVVAAVVVVVVIVSTPVCPQSCLAVVRSSVAGRVLYHV